MSEGPSGFASRDFRIGDRVRFLPGADVSERIMGLPAVVAGYDLTKRRDAGRWVDEVHVIVTVSVNGVETEQWVAAADLQTVH